MSDFLCKGFHKRIITVSLPPTRHPTNAKVVLAKQREPGYKGKVPLISHAYVLEPSGRAIVWRFLDMPKFRDLMANEEIYFRRADRFDKDPNEGVPPDDWLRTTLNLRRYDIRDEATLSEQKGTLSQFREASYISCWHLFEGETMDMWRAFAPYGVAICARYDLLKKTLRPFIDPIVVGLTRYGYRLGDPHNTIRFIYTKGVEFASEREVRVVMLCYDPFAANNRHIGSTNFGHDRPLKTNRLHPWVSDGKRRRVNLKPLVTGIVVSPWASHNVFREAKEWAKIKGLNGDVTRSPLRARFLPALR